MSKEKQLNFKEDMVTSHNEQFSQDVGWQETSNLPKGWMSKEKQLKVEEERQVIDMQQQQPTKPSKAQIFRYTLIQKQEVWEKEGFLLINSRTKPQQITWLILAKPKQPP